MKVCFITQVKVQTSSSLFLLVYVLCFQNSSSALSSLMIISTLSKFTMWFKLKLKVFFQIYVPCVQCLLHGFYHSKFTMQFKSKLSLKFKFHLFKILCSLLSKFTKCLLLVHQVSFMHLKLH
jgi:hypothetical protein